MPAVQHNREAQARSKPRTHDFTTFRMRSMNAFGAAMSGSIIMQVSAAQRLTLEEPLTTLKQSYAIPVPSGGFGPAAHPRRFDRPSEREIIGGTLAWQAGMMEEVTKLSRPGAVSNVWSQPNRAEQFGASGVALINKLVTQRLLSGDTGTHGYDGLAFFGTNKPISPDNPESPLYDNKHSLPFDTTDVVGFVRQVKRLFKSIPHPMHTPSAPCWIDQELGGLMVSTNKFEYFEEVAKDDQKIVVIKDGGTPVAGVAIANTDKGSFLVIESKTMPDNRAFGFARGAGADAAFMVHTLLGVEELPGGDFMAQDEWQAVTGSWMMPRIWELGKSSEYAMVNGQVLIGADIDADVITYAPWSAKMFVLT